MPNAFAIISTAQRCLQVGDDSLPFTERVSDGRDRLYNDLLDLTREMGISWNAPLVYGVPFLQKIRDGTSNAITIPSLKRNQSGYSLVSQDIISLSIENEPGET